MTVQITAFHNGTQILSNFYTCDWNTAIDHATKAARLWLAQQYGFVDFWEKSDHSHDTIDLTISTFCR